MVKVINFKAVESESNKALSTKELKELLARSKKGDKSAKNRILLANLGLIYKIANEIKSPYEDVENLVSLGCIRFLEIIDTYNPDIAALSTFIWQPLKQYMKHSLPDYSSDVNKFAYQYQAVVNEFMEKYGRNPSLEELSEVLGMTVRVIKNRLISMNERYTISLDKKINSENEDSETLVNSSFCATSYDASTEIMRAETEKYQYVAWERLSESERNVLSAKFLSGKKTGDRNIAGQFGVSHEKFRQLVKEAKAHYSQLLDEYGICAA